MSEHVLEEQRRYYAERAPEYDDWWFKRGHYALGPEAAERWWADVSEVEAALAAFRPFGDVAELAAGTGLWTRKLVPHASSVVAVDANPETLALNTDEAEHLVVDIFDWQPKERFDTCFFSYWLSHVPAHRFECFWKLVCSLLRPMGRVFLVDTPPGPWEQEGELEIRQLADGRQFEIVKVCRSPEEIAELAARTGFSLDLRVAKEGNILYGGGS